MDLIPYPLGIMSRIPLVLVFALLFMMKFAKAVVAPWAKWVIGYSFLKKKKIPCGSAFAKKGLRHAFNVKQKKISPLKGLFFRD